MQRILFIIHFKFIIVTHLFSQNIHQVKLFADDQFEKGNYVLALKEYQRVQLFDEEKSYQSIYKNIATIYFNQAEYENAIRYFNLAWNVETNDSLKFELAIKKVLCNILLSDYFSALNELFDIPEYNTDYFRDKKNLYTAICYFGLEDYVESNSYFSLLVDSAGIYEINKIFSGFNKYNKKYRPEKIEHMSMFLPGLGQIYTGAVGPGINSIALLSLVVAYAFYTTSVYGWIDGALVLSSWFYRYYQGGSQKANLLAREKLYKKKTDVYSNILLIVENHQKTKKLN